MTDTKMFGFWVYLMTDLIFFSVLFAAFAVLHEKELFQKSLVLTETLVLLTSSFSCSIATYFVYRAQKWSVIFWLLITMILGLVFLYLEVGEFISFIQMGKGPWQSGSLSAFFTLVGTHGFHVGIGLLWMFIAIVTLKDFSAATISRMFRMAIFWHFLDIVWIFIFTVVYLLGGVHA